MIGGGASAASSGISISTFAPGTFDTLHLLRLMGGTFIVSAILSVMFYLKQSPLPAESIEVTTTATKTETVTVTPSDGGK